MDIKRNPDLISLISNIRLEIAEAGLAMLDSRWNNSDVRSPFSRLYYIRGGEGTVLLPSGQCCLSAGSCYLIPAGLGYHYQCDNWMEQLYFHINLYLPNGIDLFFGCQDCYRLPVSDQQMQQVYQLYQKSDAASALRLKSALLGDIANLIELSGAGAQVLHYSPLLTRLFPVAQRNISSGCTVKKLAEELHVSESTLSKRFRQETGLTLGAYLDHLLFTRACQLLLSSPMSIGEISEQLGFCDQFYFARYFKNHQQQTPSEYRRRAASLSSK